MIDELATRMGNKVDIRKINMDEHMDEADRYGIQVVPTLIIEKDGRVVQTLEGLTSAQTLEAILGPLVNEDEEVLPSPVEELKREFNNSDIAEMKIYFDDFNGNNEPGRVYIDCTFDELKVEPERID